MTLALFALLLADTALGQAPVNVATPEARTAVRTLQLTGSFVAQRSAGLSPRISGLVAETPVDAGDRVAAGDVLVQLDGRLAELGVAEALAAATAAAAELAEAQRLATETRRLAADRFVAETQIAARDAAIEVARANLSVVEAALATARERLARHAVVAPFDGVIAQRVAEAGEWVQTGTPVLELVATDALWLDVRAPQQYFNELAAPVAASVRVEALDQRFRAAIHARVPVSDPDARTFLLRLALEEAPVEQIVPGMSATVDLEWSLGEQVLYVHRDAIQRFPDGSTTVWTVAAEGTAMVARERAVTVRRYEGDHAEISEGIEHDARVVVRGNEVLAEGEAVRVIEADS
ncbi:MAG: efflux RND transporter periplasmic adaptor subunit [Pseudomonadota bacterium]